jgi:putrescine transport system substrate-binding protein
MVIPADAPRPGNAHKFINYILRPEVHAAPDQQGLLRQPERRVEEVRQARGGQQPDRVPAPAELAKMVPPDALNNDLRRLMTRTYTSFKTGL